MLFQMVKLMKHSINLHTPVHMKVYKLKYIYSNNHMGDKMSWLDSPMCIYLALAEILSLNTFY